MRICFIFSSYYVSAGRLAKGGKAWVHGLTLPLLAAYIGKEHSITLVNDFVHSLPDKNSFDVFFISIMGSVLERTRDLAHILKTDNNYIIVGGKTLNEASADYMSFADSIVLGEAESLMGQILEDIKNKRLQKQYGNPLLRSSLEYLPVPRYDLIDKKRHSFIYPVEATRGCVNYCSYCYVQSWSKGLFRKRPVEQVIRDIAAIKSLGIRRLLFVDDNIFADRDYAFTLFREMIPLKMKWICQATANAIADEELMHTAAKSGLMAVTIGFESMSGETLARVNKPNDPAIYEKGIAILNRFNILSLPMFVAGLNEDIDNEFNKIYRFCLGSRATAPLLYILTPIPATPLYNEYQAAGKIIDNDLSHYNMFHVVIKLEQSFEDTYWRFYKSLYSIKNIFIRVFLKKGNIFKKIMSLAINFFIRTNIVNKQPLQLKRKSFISRKDK
jgi:radical SAM superfamily enzyme YgiQ (UPF0313 family)